MGAGVAQAGYGIGNGCRVLNNTSTLLRAGESVDWDPTQAATDLAIRVRRPTADASLSYAGVVLQDILANGGYGDLQHTGEVMARVDSAVAAGTVLTGDFVTGGICQLRIMVPGDRAACAVALTNAVETPSGSGVFWARVALLGPGQAAVQSVMRGGQLGNKYGNWTGRGAAVTFSRDIAVLSGHSIVQFEILSNSAIGGPNAANCWALTMVRDGAVAIMPVPIELRAGFALGDFSIAASTVKVFPNTLMANIVSANPCIYTVTFTLAGAPNPGPDLTAVPLSFNIVTDPGVNFPLAYGRG